jgi:HEAT repeat protein
LRRSTALANGRRRGVRRTQNQRHHTRKDIGNSTTLELAEQLAVNIRVSAAYGVARSPHPDAKKLLMTMADDPDGSVRLTALHGIQNIPGAESAAILKKLSEDKDDRVRGESLRYLKLRELPPTLNRCS